MISRPEPFEIVPLPPRSGYVTALGRELHYSEWGRSDAPPVVLWHGLARTGRDFDVLATALCDQYRLIAPDTIGRGLSEWSVKPDEDYCLAFYAETARVYCCSLKSTSPSASSGWTAAGSRLAAVRKSRAAASRSPRSPRRW